jgi:hypothetical protein
MAYIHCLIWLTFIPNQPPFHLTQSMDIVTTMVFHEDYTREKSITHHATIKPKYDELFEQTPATVTSAKKKAMDGAQTSNSPGSVAVFLS